MVTIKTCIYTGMPNTVRKSLPNTVDYKGVLNGSFSVLHPVVKFRTKEPVNFNYVHIPELQRFYFVSNIEQNGGICTAYLDIDVLMSYQNLILASTATWTKGTNTDTYVSNRENVTDVRPVIIKLNFPNKNLINEKGSIVMVTIKGNV